MGIGASVFLIAIGAILEWAVPTSVHGVHLGTIGVILMLVGILGLAAAVFIYGPRSRGLVERPMTEPARPMAEPERVVAVERPVELESDVVVERQVTRRNRPW
jgi:hypothetical protein